jgi:non-heme chloroperoxidase
MPRTRPFPCIMAISVSQMLTISALALVAALGTLRSAEAQEMPVPSRSTLITVADSVQLEVVDWGGEGPTLILLAGLGHTAHVFDGFVPRLTSRLHVMGITRRGVGASSRPTKGYDSTRLVRDLIAVLDSLRVGKASFAGHSFGGSEMSILAARFPERVDRLIYLDSAFDYRQLLDRIGLAMALGSPQPQPGAYDRGTVADGRLLGERSSGAGFPESEVRAMFRVGADDIVQGSATAPETLRAMLDGIEPAPLTKIRAATLALYAAPMSAEVMYPSWYAFDDSARQRGRSVYAAVSAEHALQRARFKREVVGSRQVIITGARHYLFLTHPGEVAHEVLSFMLSN